MEGWITYEDIDALSAPVVERAIEEDLRDFRYSEGIGSAEGIIDQWPAWRVVDAE